MTVRELCDRLKGLGCMPDPLMSPGQGGVEIFERIVDGRRRQAQVDVTHLDDELEPDTIERVCRQLGLPIHEVVSPVN